MIISISLTLASAAFAPQDTYASKGDPLPAADVAITAREMRHHVSYLASDELRGRAAGTPDAVRAAHYLVRALRAAGVKPAGDDGTYLQAMQLVRWEHNGPPELEVEFDDGERWTAEAGVDFSVRVRGEPTSTQWLEVLMVPDLSSLPDEADSAAAIFLDGSRSDREMWLQARGMEDTGAWGLGIREGASRAGKPSGAPRSRLGTESNEADRSDEVTLRGSLREQLLEGRVVALKLTYDAKRKVSTDYNVIGRLDGVGTAEHPELADEVILFSAHYDHIGVVDGHGGGHGAAPADGDSKDTVFNGADDDASGTAAVLEIAQAFAAGAPPARTLLFFLAAGEEVGLLGTYYYIDHPVVPLAQTVCNLNFEMIGRPDELAGGSGKLWLSGFERTTLGPAFQAAGLAVVPDPRLSQNFFQRSDNYAFAVRGIVGQTLSSYNMHTDYHQLTDEVEAMDFGHMEAAMRAAFDAATFLADGSLSPEWLPGGRPAAR